MTYTSDKSGPGPDTPTWEKVATPLGDFVIVSVKEIIHVAGFGSSPHEIAEALGISLPAMEKRQDLSESALALHAYFRGDVHSLQSVTVEQPGSQYFQKAWEKLRQVRAGVTTTYGGLLPEAPRVAGRACAVNRISLFVPCHRVHHSSGGLGGYTWGIDAKRWLLAHEAHFSGLKVLDREQSK